MGIVFAHDQSGVTNYLLPIHGTDTIMTNPWWYLFHEWKVMVAGSLFSQLINHLITFNIAMLQQPNKNDSICHS